MWRVRCTSVGVQSNRDLGDFFAMQAGFDDHLRGELHSSATLIEPFVHGPGKTAQATVNVVDRGMKPFPDEKRKNGLPTQRCKNGIAPGRMEPPPAGSLHPWTKSNPSRNFSMNPGISRKS